MSDECLITSDLFTDADGNLSPRLWRQPRTVTTASHPDMTFDLSGRTTDTAGHVLYYVGGSQPGGDPEVLFTNTTSHVMAVTLRVTRGPTAVLTSSPRAVSALISTTYGDTSGGGGTYAGGYIEAVGGGVDAGSSGSTRYFANQENYTGARTVYGTTVRIPPGASYSRWSAMQMQASGFTVAKGSEERNVLQLGSLREDLIISPIPVIV